MDETFFIRPANPDADLRDPVSGDRLPPDGAVKPRNAYWLTLEIRGEVIASEPKPDPRPEPAETKGRKA